MAAFGPDENVDAVAGDGKWMVFSLEVKIRLGFRGWKRKKLTHIEELLGASEKGTITCPSYLVDIVQPCSTGLLSAYHNLRPSMSTCFIVPG